MNSSARLMVPVDALDHVLGPPNEPLVVVEYGDFECPVCAQAHPAVKILLERFRHHLRLVFRHYPIVETHPHAMQAAQAAEAAGAQGKFWEMHDRMFENHRHLAAADLRNHAQALRLNLARFDAEIADQVYLQRVQEHMASARASRVHGTPTFFVDGAMVDTSFGIERLGQAIATHPRAAR
jgi:protein-disulfide isomerase